MPAPTLDVLIDLVSRLRYKAGWAFTVDPDYDRGQGCRGPTLIIRLDTVNSYDQERPFQVANYFEIPTASYNERSWRRWLLERVLDVERHEACEFFVIDGEHPYGPLHAPGNDPYMITEAADPAEKALDHRGIDRRV